MTTIEKIEEALKDGFKEFGIEMRKGKIINDMYNFEFYPNFIKATINEEREFEPFIRHLKGLDKVVLEYKKRSELAKNSDFPLQNGEERK